MAKIEKPNKKGSPPSVDAKPITAFEQIGEDILSHNLTKPDTNKLVLINFNATPEFRKELKIYAAELGLTVTQLIMEAIDIHKKTHKF